MGRALLAWYRARRRAYPWRASRPDPYGVLVSEVMLQQTQAARVAATYERFAQEFPTVADLARASRGDVIRAWGNLGYNRRAVALWAAARQIIERHGGVVPDDPEQLIGLPGVGPYTAAAVAAIAFRRPMVALDTNARRVISRAVLGMEPPAVRDRDIREAGGRWLGGADPAAWNQAVMDVGRTSCRPLPRCGSCCLVRRCAFVRGIRPGSRSRRSSRPSPAYEGSMRQVRGAIVRILRDRQSATLAALVRESGHSSLRVADAVRALAREGIVMAGPAAVSGSPKGRVTLPD